MLQRSLPNPASRLADRSRRLSRAITGGTNHRVVALSPALVVETGDTSDNVELAAMECIIAAWLQPHAG